MIASNQTFIIAAYAVTWVVMLGYLVYLMRKGARIRADYASITRPHGEGSLQ